MATPAYKTDLTIIYDFEGTTAGVELTGYAVGGSVAEEEADFFVQGSFCYSATNNRKAGLQSIAVPVTTFTMAAGECMFVWQVELAGNATNTFDTGGLRVALCTDIGNYDIWYTGGRDFGRNPLGGWQNVVVDPTYTPVDDTLGNLTSYDMIASCLNMVSEIDKGNLHGMDASRYGRGILSASFGEAANYSTFEGMAIENDLQANKWGILAKEGVGYLFKGVLQLGGTNVVDFRDSNRSITIDNTPRTYQGFNRIELHHVDSNIEWTAVNFTALSGSQLSPGQFEMIDNMSHTQNSCVFTDMDTFIYQSSASMDSSIWRRCNAMSQSSAVLDSCTIDQPNTIVSSAFMNVDDVSLITNTQFTMGTTGHAIELTSAGTYTWTGNTFSGYDTITAGSNLVEDTGPGDALVYNNSGGLITLNAGGGADSPSVRNATGATTIVSNPVTYTIGGLVSDSEVRIYPTGSVDPLDELDGVESSSTSFVYSYEYAGDQYNDIVVHHIDYVYLRLENVFMGNTNGGTTVVQQVDRWYDNP